MIVADSGPEYEGRDFVKRISNDGIKCVYTLIQGVSGMIHRVSKVFLGASSVLSNGAVLARSGSAMISCIAYKH